jgi:tRNA(His) 5'-end guanylyltransferase
MSGRYEDAMGDMLKAIEGHETSRQVVPGECAMIRLDGMVFSKFTSSLEKPYDTLMADAMKATATRLLEDCSPDFVYTQSDEITMVFGPDKILPFDGRLMKMAGAYAGQASTIFAFEALKRFRNGINNCLRSVEPERQQEQVAAFLEFFDWMDRKAPAFDGRAFSVEPEIAAQFLVWREIDARRNASLGAGRATFTQAQLGGKSPGDIKDMLTEIGIDFYTKYPNHYRRGTFMRKRQVKMMLTEEELARIPEKIRDSKRGQTFVRSRVVEVEDRPPFYAMENVAAFVFEDAEPVVVSKTFAQHLIP